MRGTRACNHFPPYYILFPSLSLVQFPFVVIVNVVNDVIVAA